MARKMQVFFSLCLPLLNKLYTFTSNILFHEPPPTTSVYCPRDLTHESQESQHHNECFNMGHHGQTIHRVEVITTQLHALFVQLQSKHPIDALLSIMDLTAMWVKAVSFVFGMTHSYLLIASAAKPACLLLGTHMTPNLQPSLDLVFLAIRR